MFQFDHNQIEGEICELMGGELRIVVSSLRLEVSLPVLFTSLASIC